MTKIAKTVLLAAAAGAFLRPLACAEDVLDPKAIDEIVAELSRISGLKMVKRVESDQIRKDQVKTFLAERVKENVKPEEIRSEEMALKRFGFLPKEFDLLETTLDLLSEQAAAFYDFHKKKLFLIDAGGDMMQHSALVHELAHALADQHFNLEKYIDRGSNNDDSALARLAVMEGQATWLMSEYLTQRTGMSLRKSPTLVNMMSRAAGIDTGQYPVFQKAPLYLRETLLFPYIQGFLFQNALIDKLGDSAFSEVFRNPPRTTRQILHPEVYLQNQKPLQPALPALARPKDYREVTEGTFGELDHQILLRQYIGEKEANALAPAWRGGAYKLFEQKDDKHIVFAYTSAWESPQAAQEFFSFYKRVLASKWKEMQADPPGEGTLTGRSEDGFFAVRLDGARVTSLEGLQAHAEAAPVRESASGQGARAAGSGLR